MWPQQDLPPPILSIVYPDQHTEPLPQAPPQVLQAPQLVLLESRLG